MRGTCSALTIVSTAAMLAMTPAARAGSFVTFFGEDVGLGETQPLPSYPTASAAQQDFLSQLVNVQVEDFEAFQPGMGGPLAVSFGAAGTATLQGTGLVAEVAPGTTDGFGRYPTSDDRYWESSSEFSIDFSKPVAAFGFFGVDVGDFDGQITLGLVSGQSEIVTVPNTMSGNGGSVLFFGLMTTDPQSLFTSITFGNTGAGSDVFAFDDFTIADLTQVANPVPLPAAAWTGLAGLGLVGAARRRRR